MDSWPGGSSSPYAEPPAFDEKVRARPRAGNRALLRLGARIATVSACNAIDLQDVTDPRGGDACHGQGVARLHDGRDARRVHARRVQARARAGTSAARKLRRFVRRGRVEAAADSMAAAIRRGLALLRFTPESLSQYVTSNVRCTSCHQDDGTKATAAPLTGSHEIGRAHV